MKTVTKKQLQEDFVCCIWRAVSKIKKNTFFTISKKEGPNNNTEERSKFLKWCNFSLGCLCEAFTCYNVVTYGGINGDVLVEGVYGRVEGQELVDSLSLKT
jgi:hypothetical protein